MLAVIPALILLFLQAGAGGDAAMAVSPETRVAWVRAMLDERVSDAGIAIIHRRPKSSLEPRPRPIANKVAPIRSDEGATWPETATEECRRPRDGPSIA